MLTLNSFKNLAHYPMQRQCLEAHRGQGPFSESESCLVAHLCPALCNRMNCSPSNSSVHGDSPGKNTRVGHHALLWGIFPTQGSNPGLLHCRWILYQLSHQGSLKAHLDLRQLVHMGICGIHTWVYIPIEHLVTHQWPSIQAILLT